MHEKGRYNEKIGIALTLSLMLTQHGQAEASLLEREGGLIYDTELNITWYDYTYTGSSGVGATWSEANAWAAGLTVGGVSGWRLPHVLPLNGSEYSSTTGLAVGSVETGFNISAPGSVYPGTKASEFAYLFYYELGNLGQRDIQGVDRTAGSFGLINDDIFNNLLSYAYWTGTEFQFDDSIYRAYQFDFRVGGEGRRPMTTLYYAMAVHEGDVGAPVPVPSAALLLGSGLLGLAGLGKRKKAAVAC